MVAYLRPNRSRVLDHCMRLLERIFVRLRTAVFVHARALARGLVVPLADLTLPRVILLIIVRLVRAHHDVLQVDVVVHVVERCLSLVRRLVELRQHVEFVVDVLRRVALRVQEHGVGVHLRVVLLLPNLHLDISRHKIVIVLLSAVPLRSRRVRGEVLVLVHRPTALALVLLLLESLLHERVLVLWVRSLRIGLHKVPVILLDGVASLRLLLNAYLIVVASALVAGVAAQATVLIRRIPYVFFVLVFDYHLLEQVVRRIG